MQPYPNMNYFAQYPQFQQQTPPPAPPQPQLARMVGGFNEITIGDIPTNGSMAFFIKNDLSEIQGRRWSEDGRVIPITYKLVEADNEPKIDPYEEIIKRLDALDEKISMPRATRKKESVENE